MSVFGVLHQHPLIKNSLELKSDVQAVLIPNFKAITWKYFWSLGFSLLNVRAQAIVGADVQGGGVYGWRAVTEPLRSLPRRTDRRVSYPVGGTWPSMAAVSGAFVRSGSIQSPSVRFQFPVPGREGQFVSPRWTHAVVMLSSGVVCAIFQFWKINIIFGALRCAAADWVEGGAQSGCEVIRAEAACCRTEQFVEPAKRRSPLFPQNPFTWWWCSRRPSLPLPVGKGSDKVAEIDFSLH